MRMDWEDNKNCGKNKHFLDSFRHAFEGVITIFKEERNMRTHVLLGIFVLICCWFFKVSWSEWLWMILSIFLVIVMEVWNTVIENVVDLITNHDYYPLAKKAKDMAAAAVLMTAGFAVIVAIVIFLPKVIKLFF